ncbi:Sporulation protein YunB [bioreactor metagenome]|uniref:Sporulation protein YunB n=1 Tax=bioreactor metagenome TaxID=1076179 RepID=A0A645BWU8_9ZZZZ
MKRYRSPLEIKLSFIGIVCFIVTLITLLMIDAKVRPILKTIASNKANNIALEVLSDSVDEVLAQNEVKYKDITYFVYDQDHKITAIKTNIALANSLESKIEQSITNRLNNITEEKISIPMGSILGGNILSGRGPHVKLYITLACNVNSNIVNLFESAGINQTRHQVQLDIKLRVSVIMTGMSTSTEVKSNVPIAETILVGVVPDAYANINK